MQLWTHHPSAFQLADPRLIVDPTKGQYWNSNEIGPRYREVLRRLQKTVGTDQFLWCCTTRGQFIRPTEETDLVEWELNIPDPSRMIFFCCSVWEDIVRSKCDDWSRLFVAELPEPNPDINAVVLLPLQAHLVKCHGQLRPKHSNAKLERARRIMEASPRLNQEERNQYNW